MSKNRNVKIEDKKDFKRVGKLTNFWNRFVLYMRLVGFWRNVLVIGVTVILFLMIGNVVIDMKDDEVSFVVDGSDVQVLLPDEKTGAYFFVSSDELDDSKKYDSGNRIQNPSFENGLWTEKVGDCHNYDDNPILNMVQSDNASDGNKSLELQAKRHIACTNQKDINVESGGIFLLKFDYQSNNVDKAGYYISFDDKEKTNISEKLIIENTDWNTFEKQIEIPSDATKATLHIYSYPEEGSKENEDSKNIIIRYDNFYLVKMPDVRDRYYYMDEFDFEMKNPTEIITEEDNGKKVIYIKGATTSFFVVADNTYNDGWKLQLKDGSGDVPNEYHFESRGYKNGWYVNVNKLCDGNDADSCTKNEDGSYDMELMMEYNEVDNSKSNCCFWNEVVISALLIGYIAWDVFDRRKRKRMASRKRMKDFRRGF